MSREALLAIELEVALAVVDNNFVVHGLAREVFHVWVHTSGGHGMHIRLADVLSDDWDTKLPYVHLFVVGS